MGGLGSVFSLLLSLVFIIVLVIISIRLLGRQSGIRLQQRLVRVVAVLPLGSNKSLQVVVLGEKRILVIGVSSHVEPVSDFEDQELAQSLLQSVPSSASTILGERWLKGLTRAWQTVRKGKESLRKKRQVNRQNVDYNNGDEWSSVQERLESLRKRRNHALNEVDDELQDGESDNLSFQDWLTDYSRRQK